MHSYYTFIALDLANQRVREAEHVRLVASLSAGRESGTRRYAAIGLAAVGRLVAAGVRRLDECVADDLVESLRPDSLAATR
jgi:hypothetical protein